MWLPKGCVGVRSIPSLHTEVLGEFRIGSKPIYFGNLGWIRDSEGVIVHRMCTSTTRCCTCGTKLLRRCLTHWCRGIEIFTTLRSATSYSSSMPMRGCNPRVRSTRIRHRSPVIVTALLLDGSWEILGCVGNNIFVICTEPQQNG
jgi:hypothetical protein